METKHVKEFVTNHLSENLNEKNVFNNLDRALKIVSTTEKLIAKSSAETLDGGSTLMSAWFLQAGFVKGHEGHVKRSCQLAETFLSDNDGPNFGKVHSLISSAWDDGEPINQEAEILRDALTAYYGSKSFGELIELQLMELHNFEDSAVNTSQWRKHYIKILRTQHHFYTEYAQENWGDQKEKNLLGLIKKLKKSKKSAKKEKLKVKLKNQSPERAIQSLYRTQLRNHLKLSDIADTKANILLSVNAIIISMLLANLIPKLGSPNNSYLIYPTIIFVIFSITSMIMSVLATRPKIENDQLIDMEMNTENTNFLFFGNFNSLALPEFKQKMKEIISSKETIYDSLTMDLYYLGLVLKKKYILLRRTYTVFIIGIILSVIAFGIAVKYYGMGQELIDAVSQQ